MYPEAKPSKDGGVNMGIAMITPASKILELLNGGRFAADREHRVKGIREKQRAEAE
jgi:hypothetical protein